MSVPVVVQFENIRVVNHLITLLENAQINWKDANTHNFALDGLNRAEPTVYMVERLKKEFVEELAKQSEGTKIADLMKKSVPDPVQ